MAARGSFGGGINPFGSSQPSGLSAYNVGYNLASLDAFKIATGWANGTVSDADYIASLQKVLNAASPDTRDQVSAQNALDDANYTIGRQAAQDKGLDQLIAFDQKSLATMRSDNNHADDVKNALASELAQRRSRDYSKIVNDVNNGKASLQSLADWVDATIQTLPSDAPDKDTWAQTKDSVAAQVQNGKDSQVYQDYQNQRMSGKDFLAYVQGRRDQYDPSSPAYADWSRKFEDATNNVKDTALSAQDGAFFDLYNEGKKSDADYLAYIKTRLDGLATTDPQYETWRHRYVTTAFSIAEDQLRFAVNQGKKPVSDLISFYKSYALTLNQGSAEWRTTQDKITSLGRSGSGGGGGGGSSSGGSAAMGPKVIDGHYTLDTVYQQLAVNPYASKADQKAQLAAWTENHDSLSKAHTAGDKVWLFTDPNHPGAVVAGQNPDGSPMLDANGNPVMVRGAAYLPVTDEALVNLNALDANYHATLANIALAKGNQKGFFTEQGLANDQLAANRSLAMQGYQKYDDTLSAMAQKAIDNAVQINDAGTAWNVTHGLFLQLQDQLQDPTLTDAQRQAITDRMSKLENGDLFSFTTMPDGKVVQTGGAIDIWNSPRDADGNILPGQAVLRPGYAFVLGGTGDKPTLGNGYVAMGTDDQTWHDTHVQVADTFNGVQTAGYVKILQGAHSSKVMVTINGVPQLRDIPSSGMAATYQDQNGNTVHAYSLDDGATWISSTSNAAPMLQLQGNYREANGVLIAADGPLAGLTVGTWDPKSGTWKLSADAPIGWYGSFGGVKGDEGALGLPGTHFTATGALPGNVLIFGGTDPNSQNTFGRQDVFMGTQGKTPGTGSIGSQDIIMGKSPNQAHAPWDQAVLGGRKVSQPGTSNQDVNLNKGQLRSLTPLPKALPTGTGLPAVMHVFSDQDVLMGAQGLKAPRAVTTPGTSIPGGSANPNATLTPPVIQAPAPLRLRKVEVPAAPVVQSVRPISQPGTSNQDVTPGKIKTTAPPTVIQPPKTLKAV